jgi:hypothetical protein
MWVLQKKILRIRTRPEFLSLGLASTAVFQLKLAEKRRFKFYTICINLSDPRHPSVLPQCFTPVKHQQIKFKKIHTLLDTCLKEKYSDNPEARHIMF